MRKHVEITYSELKFSHLSGLAWKEMHGYLQC